MKKLDGWVDLQVYAVGVVCMSVCVVKSAALEDIERAANDAQPPGDNLRWRISEDPFFASGPPNPCECESTPDRLHYLLNC